MFYIDVSFRLFGDCIPVDHGYHMYSSISKVLPEIHGDEEIALHPVSGVMAGNRKMKLNNKSCLRIRLPSHKLKSILPIAGKEFDISGHKIRTGFPVTHNLVSSARLYSRLVTIKGFMEPDSFIEAVQRQAHSLGVSGRFSLITQFEKASLNSDGDKGTKSPFLRRTLRIRDKEIAGYALSVSELTAEESIILQEKGIGGRRRFGCGVFIPDRR